MSLDASLRVSRGSLRLEVDLAVDGTDVVALVGPNGAGKTTTLRALAGLLELDGGHVRLGGDVHEDVQRRVRLPPERRPIGVVFQDYLLFPHLSALENVAFGLRAQGMDRTTAREHARTWLGRVDLVEQADVRPSALSGGQAQRVALARALVLQPRLLLLDEPLAALDAATRLSLRADLSRHLREFTGPTVLVTHDLLDAMVLADRLVVLESGRVVQDGSPSEVARHPRTPYVARLVGLNLLHGEVARGVVEVGGHAAFPAADHLRGPVFIAFPPSAVAVHGDSAHGDSALGWPATVAGLEQYGDSVRLSLHDVTGADLDLSADVSAATVAELGLVPGVGVWAAVQADAVEVYPA